MKFSLRPALAPKKRAVRLRGSLVWCLLLLVVWAAWLWQLEVNDLSFDETATYFVAHRPLAEMLGYLQNAIYEHPPFYYLLINSWMNVAGRGEFSLRFVSVAIGLLALPIVGWVARQGRAATGAAVGLAAAVLLAAMPGMAEYARNARMYSLCVVWTLLSAGLFVRDWLSGSDWPRRSAFLLLGLVHAAALFTHYYLLLPMLLQPLALLLSRRWRPLLAWLGMHSVPALAGLAWLGLAPGLQASAAGLRLSFALPPVADVLQLLRLLVFSQLMRVPFALLYVVLALVALGIVVAWRRNCPLALWLTLTATVPLLLAYQLPRVPSSRYVLFLLPCFALALGCWATVPLDFRWRRLLRVGAASTLTVAASACLVVNGMGHVLSDDSHRYGHTLETIQAYADPQDGLLFYGPWQWIEYRYYDPGGLPPITLLPRQAPPTLSPQEALPVLETLLANYERLWVVPAAVDNVDPSHFVAGWLNSSAHAVWERADFTLYMPPLPADAPAESPQVAWGDLLLLDSVAWEGPVVPAGEPLRITLRWLPLQSLPHDVRLVLRLVDERGRTWYETFPIPQEWAHPPSTWAADVPVVDYEGVMVPPGAPPGPYTVRLGLIDETTRETLTMEAGAEVDLFTVDVVDPPNGLTDADLRPYLPFSTITGPAYWLGDFDRSATHVGTFCQPQGTACLTLLGYELNRRVPQGYPFEFVLYWQAPDGALPALDLRLEILPGLAWPGVQASAVASKTLPIAGDYSTVSWTPDRLVSMRVMVPLSPDVVAGPARAALEVWGQDGVPWSVDGQQRLLLTDLQIVPRSMLRRLPGGVTPLQVSFGDEIELRGYRIEGQAVLGETIRVTYYWYARNYPTAVYAVFNHLMTPDGQLVDQADGWPQGGTLLTTQWRRGEYIEDPYTLQIPSDAPPGPYQLLTGLYDANSGDRLPVVQNGQRMPDDRLLIPLLDGGEP